jgi:hypothetical protein
MWAMQPTTPKQSRSRSLTDEQSKSPPGLHRSISLKGSCQRQPAKLNKTRRTHLRNADTVRRLAFFTLFCVGWFNPADGRPVEALSAPRKTVLVLHGDRLAIPAVKATDQGLMTALSRGQPEDPEIFSEYLDLVRFPADQYGDDLVRYLRARYAARKPDVVIAVGNSLELVLARRDELFAGVPIVFCECGPS